MSEGTAVQRVAQALIESSEPRTAALVAVDADVARNETHRILREFDKRGWMRCEATEMTTARGASRWVARWDVTDAGLEALPAIANGRRLR